MDEQLLKGFQLRIEKTRGLYVHTYEVYIEENTFRRQVITVEELYEKLKNCKYFEPSEVSLYTSWGKSVLIRGYYDEYIKRVLVHLSKVWTGKNVGNEKIPIHPPPNPNSPLPNSLDWMRDHDPRVFFLRDIDKNTDKDHIRLLDNTDEQCILFVQHAFETRPSRFQAIASSAAYCGRPRVLREVLELGWPIKYSVCEGVDVNLLEIVLSNYHCKTSEALDMVEILVHYGADVEQTLKHHGEFMTPVEVCDGAIKFLQGHWDGTRCMNPEDNVEKISLLEEVKKRLIYHIEKKKENKQKE